MAFIPQTFANGDTNYIAKHNANNAAIASLVNVLEQEVAALKAAGASGSDLDYRLNAANLLINGGFGYWQRGTSEPPDAWKVENDETGFSVARSTGQAKLNTYSAWTDGIGQLTQKLSDAVRLSLSSSFSLAFGCWVWTDVANSARIGIDNGVTTTWSAYHVGNSAWQFLKVALVQGAGPIPSQIKFILDNDGAEVYWNAAVVIRGNPASGPVFIANDATTERLRALSLYEIGQASVAGVGFLDGTDRMIVTHVTFLSPKNAIPIMTLETAITGFDLIAGNIDTQGFDLIVMEIGGVSGTDGFEYANISWIAEVAL